jgi:predicted metal-dependent phosphoesterase TrpH
VTAFGDGAFRFIADLHAHTTASDGLVSPAALAELASERGISIFAVTDHDTTGGLAQAARAAEKLGITFINGIELSTRARFGQTHILGYGIDPSEPQLNEELLALRESRRQRGTVILERLRAIGIDIEVALPDGEEQSIGRPHVARALVESGHAASIGDAFDRYLAVGRPAFAPRRTLTAECAIELIRAAGGIAVLAHPLSVDNLAGRLPHLLASGLQGLEAHYGEYGGEQRNDLARLALSHGLLITGGSDFHGDVASKSRSFGSVSWPSEDVERFLMNLPSD